MVCHLLIGKYYKQKDIGVLFNETTQFDSFKPCPFQML